MKCHQNRTLVGYIHVQKNLNFVFRVKTRIKRYRSRTNQINLIYMSLYNLAQNIQVFLYEDHLRWQAIERESTAQIVRKRWTTNDERRNEVEASMFR